MKDEKDPNEDFNPIDEDQVAENPGLLPYPHSIGSPAFKPNEEGVIKSRSLKSMEQQCDRQLGQIKEQIDLLARQAEGLKERMEVSKAVYAATMSFEPLVGETYHLYARQENEFVLSMVGPDEWGNSAPFTHFVATVELLADRTWEVLNQPEQGE
jgi:hypothetical protein